MYSLSRLLIMIQHSNSNSVKLIIRINKYYLLIWCPFYIYCWKDPLLSFFNCSYLRMNVAAVGTPFIVMLTIKTTPIMIAFFVLKSMLLDICIFIIKYKLGEWGDGNICRYQIHILDRFIFHLYILLFKFTKIPEEFA